MRKRLMAVLMSFGLLAGCDGEPAYTGVSFVAFNYTQFDMDTVRLTDKRGESAFTMQVSAGAGEGSVSCCYSLKGTEFTAKWRATDSEILRQHLDEGNTAQYYFTREKTVTFPPEQIPPGDGPLYLELHIYPDEHVEMALSRKLLGDTRLPIVETARWLWREHKDALGDFRNGVELTRVIARVTKTSWGKYRIEDAGDMRAYMKMYFTVASNFDQDPTVKAELERKDRKPGDFARVIESLSPESIAAMKQSGTAPGAKNG
ncbi:DUF3304 domain-containing protein [Bordetella sp. N]|uniref:DUF3304 domain-containing protein n=1 Tax=Bordetella sp. N TaxID=1746199 RepID=UPI00070B8AB8|nr:DUF3304 domain-containing protein [Bordetella sp. N]ALM84295.1 hypothetical protein ASB57_16120 [Bordetella sp. N]